MPDSPKRRRSLVTTLVSFLVVGVMLVVLTVIRFHALLFRRNIVSLDALKFPVLILQPGGVAPFAEWDSTQLEKFPKNSLRTPVNGTIVIDSDFNVFTQENVERQQEGEIKAIARFLLPSMRVKYTFDLRRMKETGASAAMKLVSQCNSLSDNPAENTRLRQAAASQTTLAGVLDALKLYKPVEPPPTTEPAALEPGEPLPATPEPEPGENRLP